MSDTIVEPKAPSRDDAEKPRTKGRRRVSPAAVAIAALVLVVALVPLYVGGFFLQAGLFVMASIVGAIGLNLLSGLAGQLSLAHAFFLGIGGYGYAILSGGGAEGSPSGAGLPPVVAAVLAIGLAGGAGAVFSPLASRLRDIYLAIASLGLVFLGLHLLHSLPAITGSFNGLAVTPFSFGPVSFADSPEPPVVLGVPFGRVEMLWYLFLVLAVGSALVATAISRGRHGRALRMIRDHEIGAAVMGVPVPAYKARIFVLSSLFAGLAGVMLALAYSRVVPETFGFALSVDYLAMIVIGGLGSVSGAVLGALFVTGLSQLLPYYSTSLPFLAQPGEDGVSAGTAARMTYGALIVLCVLFLRGGLTSLVSGLRTHLGRLLRDRAA